MLSSRGDGVGGSYAILTAILVLGQIVLLLIVVLRMSDSIPRLDPIQVHSISNRTDILRDISRDRTVQSSPAKGIADETTDHVP